MAQPSVPGARFCCSCDELLTERPRFHRSDTEQRDAFCRRCWRPLDHVRQLLERLDTRLEAQTFRKGADRCAALVDAFHDQAGFLERRVLPFASELSARDLAQHLRKLLTILRRHDSLTS